MTQATGRGPRPEPGRAIGEPGGRPCVYFDYNASAPLLDVAREAMVEAMGCTGNASSIHGRGRATRRLLEDARAAVAQSVGAAPQDVVFTSGATEANALACAGRPARRVLASAIEHDSVRAVAGPRRSIPVRPDGTLDLVRLTVLLEEDPRPELVAIMLANNETGVIQPVVEAAALVRAAGALVHCDAVQGWRRMPFTLDSLGVDSLSLSAHKAGGPKGAGALIVRDGVLRQALLRGGGQERGWRAGTENVAALAGFGAVAATQPPASTALRGTRDVLEDAVCLAVPETHVIARQSDRLPNTSMLALPGRDAEALVIRLDLEGIAVSAGSACSSGKVGPSHVLAAMNLAPELASGAIRVSFGPEATRSDVDAFVSAWSLAAAARGRPARS